MITKKKGFMKADKKEIKRLAEVVGRAYRLGARNLLIVHGAGSFGHAPVIKYGLNSGAKTKEKKLACALVHSACGRLSSYLTEALIESKVPAISIPPALIARCNNRRLAFVDEKAVFYWMDAGFVPVLYGDMVPDSKLGMSVCSGDQIVSYFSKHASRIIMATDVDGVLSGKKLVLRITKGNIGKIRKCLKSSSAPDVTGGMAGKIEELLKCKPASFIVNARKGSRVLSLLLGKKALATRIN